MPRAAFVCVGFWCVALGNAMKIFGILNITSDSFSDGGRFLAPDAALAQGRKLAADGADVVDIGAASSNPDSAAVAPDVEIARLESVLPALKADGAALSIDTFNTEVQRWALTRGVDYLNDIHGFPDAVFYPELADASPRLIVMHMVQARGVATRTNVPPDAIWDRILAFFDARIAALERAGIARDRLILDPGMGQFVGTGMENSLVVLDRFPELRARYGLPVLLSVSRKGFLRRLTGLDVHHVGPASLAAELSAAAKGVDYIRTHDPAALVAGLKVLKAMEKCRPAQV
jgi:dihydropteroate synthase type 2